MIPYDDIAFQRDRSRSLRLVELLQTEQKPHEMDRIISTLADIDDYRTYQPLTSLLLNAGLNDAVRDAASQILSTCDSAETMEQRRIWWQSGDNILRRHVIRIGARTEEDLIAQIASDPTHEFHIDSIKALEFGFDGPRFQSLKIAALAHPDSAVRAVAAKILIWEEPVAAEIPLLSAARDEVDSVFEEALDTLAYYRTKNVLIEAYQQSRAATGKRRKSYENVFYWVKREFQHTLSSLQDEGVKAAEYFRNWLGDANDLLALPDDEEETTCGTCCTVAETINDSEPALPNSVSEIISLLSEHETCRNSTWIHRIDWSKYSNSERKELTKFFLSQVDPWVQEQACVAFASWNDSDNLLGYFDSPFSKVTRTAAYRSRQISPDARIAAQLLELLEDQSVGLCYATEVIESYLVHAPEFELNSQLKAFAIDDERDSVRYSAIYALLERRATAELLDLMSLLQSPPSVNWDVHEALLISARTLELTVPGFSQLMTVDSLAVQEEVARIYAQR